MQSTISVFKPRTIAQETLDDPSLAITDENRNIVIFCPRNRVGELWRPAAQNWMLVCPVTREAWMGMLQEMNVRIPDAPELQAWLDRIDQVLLELEPPGAAN